MLKHKHIREHRTTIHEAIKKYKLTPTEPLDLNKCKNFSDFLKGYSKAGFGARKVGEAADVLHQMVTEKECFVVGTFSGAMTIAKMGLVLCDMIDNGMLDAVVTTGALMAHGFVEANGKLHFKYNESMDDETLCDLAFDRVYDTLELEKNLDDIELIVNHVLGKQNPKIPLSSQMVCRELGRYLSEHSTKRGILRSAFENNVPIYIPAFTDSELGLDFGLFNRLQRMNNKPMLQFDPFIDLEHFTALIQKQKTLGIFTVGGGVPRNWAQQVGPYLDLIRFRVLYRGKKEAYFSKPNDPYLKKYKYAVRICPEPAFYGGLCLHGDTKIEMPRNLAINPDGIPIKELVGKSNFPVYSYDPHKKRNVLSNVSSVHKTGRKKLFKLTYGWSTGWANKNRGISISSIIASGDHKFMLKDGTFKKLSELKINDRLMPFNSYYKHDTHGMYRFISLNNGKHLPEHRFIMREIIDRQISAAEVVHHKDHNTLNNSIENLEIMDFKEHAKYHRFTQSEESREKRILTLKEITDPKVMKKMSRKFWDGMTEEQYKALCEKRRKIAMLPIERLRRSAVAKRYWNSLNVDEKQVRLQNAHLATAARWASLPIEVRSSIVSNERNGRWLKGIKEGNIKDALIKENGIITRAAERIGVSVKVFNKRMEIYGVDDAWIEENCVENHYVISIEDYGEDETFDMTVDNTHNFAANGIIVSNSGCTYSEGVSWGKFVSEKDGGRFAEVLADATIAWPLIVKAVLERMGKK